MANDEIADSIRTALSERFGKKFAVDAALPGLDQIAQDCRPPFASALHVTPDRARPVAAVCACALSAPSKSDLQQCDIVVVRDMAIRKAIVATIPDMPWIMDAPAFLVFAANGNRLPELCKMHGKPFPNDHLDQFFNAAVDTGIVLATFIAAAAAIGLGCCPISAIRDHPQVVSDALNLPDRVIPVAGLCVGWPAQAGEITPRLSLDTTVVENNYGERDLAGEIDAYDRRRAALRPYRAST